MPIRHPCLTGLGVRRFDPVCIGITRFGVRIGFGFRQRLVWWQVLHDMERIRRDDAFLLWSSKHPDLDDCHEYDDKHDCNQVAGDGYPHVSESGNRTFLAI